MNTKTAELMNQARQMKAAGKPYAHLVDRAGRANRDAIRAKQCDKQASARRDVENGMLGHGYRRIWDAK